MTLPRNLKACLLYTNLAANEAARFEGFKVSRFQGFKVSRFHGVKVSMFQGVKVKVSRFQ